MGDRHDLWIVECRDTEGKLDLRGKQPDEVFGNGAIYGMTSTALSRMIFKKFPDAVLRGDNVRMWPSLFDSRWTARVKTW